MNKLQWGFSALALALAACGSHDGSTPDPTPSPTPLPTPVPTPSPSPAPTPTPSSLGADGWASVAGGTTGGDGAAADKIYTVHDRNELIQALYGGTATINDDGSFSGTLDSAKKIIYVAGTISLNMNKALVEQTADDYVADSCAKSTYGYADEKSLWTDYYAAYRPSAWGNTTEVSGKPEDARHCAANAQKNVVELYLPSNTSIIGLGSDARIIHGNLLLGHSDAQVDNVVIRNITFEDSFDFFPQWDPTDSTTGRWNSAYDLVSVLYASHVWIDHDTFSDGARLDGDYPSVWTETVNGVDYTGSDFEVEHHDGLVDLTKLGNLVTISNSLFFNHNKSFLIGGTDTPKTTAENPTVLKVTFHDDYFQGLRQRQPRARYGMVHSYNNYFTGTRDKSAPYPWLVGFTIGQSGKIVAENNVFDVGGGADVNALWSVSVSSSKITACTTLGYTTEQCTATFHDTGTVLNGAAVDLQQAIADQAASKVDTTNSWKPADYYSYTLKPSSDVKASVTAAAGAGKL
ncbi:MAG: pectate lyase family protein [Sphingomonas sp.]